MKTLLWCTGMVAAWLLTAGFAWQYATNAYVLERLEGCVEAEQQRLNGALAERKALEREAIAIQGDPFYAELLLRRTLRWVRLDEIAPRLGPAAHQPPLAWSPGAPRPSRGSDRAVFVSLPRGAQVAQRQPRARRTATGNYAAAPLGARMITAPGAHGSSL